MAPTHAAPETLPDRSARDHSPNRSSENRTARYTPPDANPPSLPWPSGTNANPPDWPQIHSAAARAVTPAESLPPPLHPLPTERTTRASAHTRERPSRSQPPQRLAAPPAPA